MAVSATWCLETGVGSAQAGVKATGVRHYESLVRSPAPGHVTLLLHQTKAVLGGTQMFLVAQHQVGLHCRVECIDMTVGMFARQNILVFGERIKVFLLN